MYFSDFYVSKETERNFTILFNNKHVDYSVQSFRSESIIVKDSNIAKSTFSWWYVAFP